MSNWAIVIVLQYNKLVFVSLNSFFLIFDFLNVYFIFYFLCMFRYFLKRLEKVIIFIIYYYWFAISKRWWIVWDWYATLLILFYFYINVFDFIDFTLSTTRSGWFLFICYLLLIFYYFIFLFLLFFLVFCFLRWTLFIKVNRNNILALLLIHWFLMYLSSLVLGGGLYDDGLLACYIFIWLLMRYLIISRCAIKLE